MRKQLTAFLRRTGISFITCLLSVGILCSGECTITSHAVEIDYAAEEEARRQIPVESNSIAGWPTGPVVSADSAILMDADTGTILYAKNIYAAEYPASTTKLLTGLIAYENCSMDEKVYFSADAINAITWDSSHMAAKPGEIYTMEQSLYGLLVGSANETANAIGEHISGTMEDFATLMNQTAADLGCVNSHFMNANGLFHEDHYTCAYDLAVIARAFFGHEILCKMSSTYSYQISEENTVFSHNKLLPNCAYAYPYLVGSKTGYTDRARQTLVTCAQKDGMKLICVVLKEESPSQFTDTIALLNYGFGNYRKYNISENDPEINIRTYDFFQSEYDVFGNSQSILTPDPDASVILPVTAAFSDTEKSILYEETDAGRLATIIYRYAGVTVGTCNILIRSVETAGSADAVILDTQDGMPGDEFLTDAPDGTDGDGGSNTGNASGLPDGSGGNAQSADRTSRTIFINVKHVLYWILGITGALIVLFIVRKLVHNYQFGFSRRRQKIRRNRRSGKRYKRYHGRRDN